MIEPLFMDDLRAEFERVKARRVRGRLAALRQFQAKLGTITFFDPACGCGNFLIIAYRELRLLEIEVIREIRDATAATTQAVLDTAWQSVVDVDQFYGIELGEFLARIAETALWMMDHIMNNRLSLEFRQTFFRIPLEKSPHIVRFRLGLPEAMGGLRFSFTFFACRDPSGKSPRPEVTPLTGGSLSR